MDYSTERKKNFKRLFNLYVGSNGQPYTPTYLEKVLAIPKNTIHSHMNEFGSMPTLACLFLYMKIFDVSFSNALLSYVGLEVVKAEEHETPSTQQTHSATARLLHKVAVALEDGQIDASEKRMLSPIMRDTATKLTALANQYDEEISQ